MIRSAVCYEVFYIFTVSVPNKCFVNRELGSFGEAEWRRFIYSGYIYSEPESFYLFYLLDSRPPKLFQNVPFREWRKNHKSKLACLQVNFIQFTRFGALYQCHMQFPSIYMFLNGNKAKSLKQEGER